MLEDRELLIFCCIEEADPAWKWVAPKFTSQKTRWKFFNANPKNFLERHIHTPSLKRIRASHEIIKAAIQQKPDLIVVHSPNLAFYINIFISFYKLTVPVIIYCFNFPQLPKGFKQKLMKRYFQSTDRFVVASKFEKQLYSEWFNLDPQKIDVVLWGVNPPKADPSVTPLREGQYISAIGSNARDYQTLLAAMEKLPHIPLLAVVTPQNLKGLSIPKNVVIYENLPLGKTLNILKFSQFTVIPLQNQLIPCGHVTLVAALYFSVPFIITDSQGIVDYLDQEEHALTYPAESVAELVKKISFLWEHPEICQQMGAKGLSFVEKNCTEQTIFDHFTTYLKNKFD